jgi:hypothetical protein
MITEMTPLLTGPQTPPARGDAAPAHPPLSAHPVPHSPTNFQTLRKLLRLGHSYAVTIPDAWVTAHVNPKLPYLTTRPNDDGTITLAPFSRRQEHGAK